MKSKRSYLSHFLYALLIALVYTPASLQAQAIQANLLGIWDDPTLPIANAIGNRYNDIWGVVVDDVEYAVIGSCNGVHFIDIAAPGGPAEVAFAEGDHTGPAIIHRDYHSYQHYLYTVADEGSNSTLQVIDFSGLPNSVEIVYSSNEFLTQSHNIFIDEDNARLYTTNGLVLSLADPTQPTFMDNLGSNGLPVPSTSHDIFARDNILYINGGGSGFFVVDYNDVDNPVLLGTMTDYPQQGYNHAGWLSDDGSHYFLCDETHGTDVKSVSVEDMSDIHVVDLFNSGSESPTHISHNAMVRGDYLYVSYYYDGLQVFDISNPEKVFRKFHFDTYPGDGDFFAGAWGIYALLPSGKILLSDMQSGMYVFELPADTGLYTSDQSFSSCIDQTLSFDLLVGNDLDANGVNVTVAGAPAGVNVNFDGNMVAPGSIINVTVDGLTTDNLFDLVFTADDGTISTNNSIQFEIFESMVDITTGAPADGSTNVSINPNFIWLNAPGINEYLLEVSTDPAFDAADVVISETVSSAPYSPATSLESGTDYYWRLTAGDFCARSEVSAFSTAVGTGLADPFSNDIMVYPNPVIDHIEIQLSSAIAGELQITLTDVSGKVVQQWLKPAQDQISLATKEELTGLYFLTIKNEGNSMTQKLIIR